MTMHTTADRFKELGLKAPDISFFVPPPKPGDRFGREPQYNTRVLVDNWYEDRRQYKTLCHRCTGPTIYKTDYQPYCPDENAKQFPPVVYQKRLEAEGENPFRNSEDYCQYMQNYTTTYDLMHNWEVRRAGVKPKPWRRWRMVQGSNWAPQNDNAVSFGNLTQLGYRKAGQLPLLPNDWDLYANTGYITEYKESFPKRRYPEDYQECRKAPNKEIVKEIRELTIMRKPEDPTATCGEASLYFAESKNTHPCCPCRGRNGPRFGNNQAFGMRQEHLAKQTLHLPRQIWPYKAMKHPPYLPPEPCRISKLKRKEVPDYCRDYAGNTRFDFKGVFRDGHTL